MVGSIGSTASDLLQQYQMLQGSNSEASTEKAGGFEGLLSGTDSTQNADKTASAGGAEGSGKSGDSTEQTSEMDLNKDGQVTIDEVIKYMQMQMTDKMSEQMSSDEGTQQAASQGSNYNNLNDFKNQQATKAYLSSQNVMNSVTSMISQSFMI